MDNEILARVDIQRRELEENTSKLRKSLRHWQTLEIDYEGLKEEFQGLPEDTSYEECLKAADEFKPDLVDRKELHSLFDDRRRGHRRPSQLVDTLSKRIEYVTRNISTIRKQLSDAEKKRNALLLAQDPETQDDAGLPLSEIVEELDEDGQVVSSRVQAPSKDAPDLIDVLRKAGVTDIKSGRDSPKEADALTAENFGPSSVVLNSESSSLIPEVTPTSSETQHVEELSDEDDVSSKIEKLGPTNPNDDEEDAALRQEMLQYGLDEVGAIVATLDLEDAGNLSFDEDEDEDYLSDYDENEDLYSDESEDEKGATKNPVISERYRRQMEALSKKHGITDLQNLGPDPSLPAGVKEQLDRPPAAEAARKAAIQRDEASKSVMKSPDTEDKSGDEPKKKRKKVAFAPTLDIAKEASAASTIATTEPAVNPVGEAVVERTHSTTAEKATIPSASTPPSTSKKMSRFKTARSTTPSTPMFPPPMDFPSSTSTSKPIPEGPPGRTISEGLVERPASQTSAPADPSDFNEALHHREVAVEYQKLRNRKMHEQGGYVRGGEVENYGEEIAAGTTVDEITGKPRKLSRFKAARLKSET